MQTAYSVLEVKKAKNAHIIAQGNTVIWRGWADFYCKPTSKSGRLQYAITWQVKDGRVTSYDEMTDSGMTCRMAEHLL